MVKKKKSKKNTKRKLTKKSPPETRKKESDISSPIVYKGSIEKIKLLHDKYGLLDKYELMDQAALQKMRENKEKLEEMERKNKLIEEKNKSIKEKIEEILTEKRINNKVKFYTKKLSDDMFEGFYKEKGNAVSTGIYDTRKDARKYAIKKWIRDSFDKLSKKYGLIRTI